MKHIKDVQNLISEGNIQEALEVLENVLLFSPNNPQALYLKAKILDSLGHFQESFLILQKVNRLSDDEEYKTAFQERLYEDRRDNLFSIPTEDGRVYYPFSRALIFISAIGLVSCLLFLIFGSNIYMAINDFPTFLGVFFIAVISPWIAILLFNYFCTKKISVTSQSIQIFQGMSHVTFLWDEIKCVVIQHENNINIDYLQLIAYGYQSKKPLFNLNISRHKSVVVSRRHLTLFILNKVKIFSYLPRNFLFENREEIINFNGQNEEKLFQDAA